MHRLRYLIGLCVLAGAVLGALWIVRLLRTDDDRPGLALKIEFRNAQGLRAGTDVRYRGVQVGTVRSVAISDDGDKAVASLRIDPAGAKHARVNSEFWVVRPRFGGLTSGASGLDTLVRDSYVAFSTPPARGSLLASGSLIAGSERPPSSSGADAVEDVRHGDLLMTLLVPENHGLEPGSAVIFRGMQTGDVQRVELAPSGTHVEVDLRITREYRQTVTDRVAFWVARPQVSGALFSGFTVNDVSSLLQPYVSYHGAPGAGVLVEDGYVAVAEAERPEIELGEVPSRFRTAPRPAASTTDDGVVLVRVSYAAVERDTFSRDDDILRHGSGVLYRDASGRAVVVTARSLVDASFTERELWGDPSIGAEQLKAMLPDGTVLRAGRVWVDPDGADLAALVLENAPPGLFGTSSERFGAVPEGERAVRVAGPDGAPARDVPLHECRSVDLEQLGALVHVGGQVAGLLVFGPDRDAPAVQPLDALPADLRPR
jgi:hypothetical protein